MNEETDSQEEAEETEKPEGGMEPFMAHIPIDCDVTNLNTLDDLAFAAGEGRARYAWGNYTSGHGGEQFLLTLRLKGGNGVTPKLTPFNVELRYVVRQQGQQVTTGAFLFNPPAIVTFRAQAPNDGSFTQETKLQTIRFYAARVPYGDAEVSIYPFYHGKYVGAHKDGTPDPTKFTIHAPTAPK